VRVPCLTPQNDEGGCPASEKWDWIRDSEGKEGVKVHGREYVKGEKGVKF